MNKKIALAAGGVAVGIALLLLAAGRAKKPPVAADYNPAINPADFTKEITNPYFSLPIGKQLTFESQTEEGLEKTEIQITGETKTISSVETLVYWDRSWVDGELAEDTKDYLAQDKEGNVWYFGEDVANYEDGQLVNHAGSWRSGVNGAKPGIWIKRTPQVGESYRQEYSPGVAEDTSNIVATSEMVTTKYGTFTGCLKTYDWTPLETTTKEYKYYCPEVGGLILVEDAASGERDELVSVTLP